MSAAKTASAGAHPMSMQCAMSQSGVAQHVWTEAAADAMVLSTKRKTSSKRRSRRMRVFYRPRTDAGAIVRFS
jgi:hypothetical protein